MSILNDKVRHYGTTGRGISARENVVIKTTKALHLLSATAWAGGSFSMQALSYLRLTQGLDEATQAHVAFALRFIDTWVVMPGLAGCISSPLPNPTASRPCFCSSDPVFCPKASGRPSCRP